MYRINFHNAQHRETHFNPLNAELNPIYHLLALLGSHHILHVSRIRVSLSCLEVGRRNFYSMTLRHYNEEGV